MRRNWCLALVVWAVLAPSAFSQHVRSLNKIPGRIESTAQRLTHQLERQGYEVARGYFRLYTKEDCDYSYAVLKSCFANNPAAPYIIPVLPTWPDEWLDPNLNGVLGPTYLGYSTTYRLDPREAIVILGRLPPPSKYFGLQTNVFTREGDFDRDSDRYKTISAAYPGVLSWFFSYDPLDSTRIQLLASLGNSINNVVIENASGEAFNRDRHFLITPDHLMEQAVKGAFRDGESRPPRDFAGCTRHPEFLIVSNPTPAVRGGQTQAASIGVSEWRRGSMDLRRARVAQHVEQSERRAAGGMVLIE